MEVRRLWSAGRYVRKTWPDGCVVHNESSGNTHLISSLAAQILDQLSQRPTDSISVARYLALENGIDMGNDLVVSVEALLANLESLGLIESSNQ